MGGRGIQTQRKKSYSANCMSQKQSFLHEEINKKQIHKTDPL